MINFSSKNLYQHFDEESKKRQFEHLYQIGKKIGEGLHSSVYMCYSIEDNEKLCPYAVKVTAFDDEEQQMAQKKEYDILASLNHENIIRVHDYFHNEMTNQ